MTTMEARSGYDAYLEARDAVRRITGAEAAGGARPSDYWAEELSNIDYLAEASPLIVRKLRHHAFHITGIRPYDYRVQDDARREAFERRLNALRARGGDELLVPEHEALGGFGYRLPQGLFNLDTLKFYEVLVGMKLAGVIERLQGPAPVMLEIGAGWGGLAYQVKTLFPRVTYVIVDFPELFLFSATYLRTVFPDARIVFADRTPASEWSGADFVFVPHTMAERVRGIVPDVTVNVASFQEMTSAQVDGYARLASDAGSPLLYSLNRERSRYNAELSSVSSLVGRYYDLREVDVLPDDYTKATKKPAKGDAERKASGGEDFTYHHLVGQRRSASLVASAPAPRTSTAGAVVGIGATLFNRAAYLREALDSILSQSFADFRLVLVDDGSTDGTESIAREYVARDARVSYIRHAQRQGMTATWRHAFAAATADPAVRYFAWASDHDRWHAEWLARMVGELERHPGLVLAYPFTRRIDAGGALLDKPARQFETIGMASLEQRWPYVCGEHVASGDMVYGLMRVDAARRAGVFRDVMCPDRLLMAELALQGEFRQVPEELWFRRQFGEGSVVRQRTTLFAGRAPRGRWLPPWAQHGRALWRTYVTAEADPARRRAAARRVLRYTLVYALKHHRKSSTHRLLGSALRSITWTRKRIKHYVLLGVYWTLVYGRRGYHRSVYEVLMFTRRIGLRGR